MAASHVWGDKLMLLFDDIHRTYMGSATQSEDKFTFLNRSALPTMQRIRTVFQNWFENWPEEDKSELRHKFESDFESAFYELFAHELLCRHSISSIIHHPQLQGTTKRPDFLVNFVKNLMRL